MPTITKTMTSTDRIDGDGEGRVWAFDTDRDNTGQTVQVLWLKPDGTTDVQTGAVNGTDNTQIDWTEPADYFKTGGAIDVAYWKTQARATPVPGGERHGKWVAVPIVDNIA